jgi:NAD(P)H dehydrogenase (quinone)
MGCNSTKVVKTSEKSKSKPKRIMIIFYSMYGHVEKLAREILKGVNTVPGVIGELWAVEETLPQEVLSKMGAASISKDINVLSYDKINELKTADGFLFGMPTRFGAMPAQMKNF